MSVKLTFDLLNSKYHHNGIIWSNEAYVWDFIMSVWTGYVRSRWLWSFNLWPPHSFQSSSLSLSGCLCRIWKNNLKVVLKYQIQENGTDGKPQKTMPPATECKRSSPKSPKASSHWLFYCATIPNTGDMINKNWKRLFIIHNVYELSSFIYYWVRFRIILYWFILQQSTRWLMELSLQPYCLAYLLTKLRNISTHSYNLLEADSFLYAVEETLAT